jgi:beta-lactamase regulating signal transducer with metallopeptidase domain
MAYQQGFKSLKFKNQNESSTTMPIGLQEWISMMIPMIMIPMTSKMKMKNTTTKKTKKKKSRTNSNKSTLKRSKTSSEMQEETPTQTCMSQTITPMRNNWNNQ